MGNVREALWVNSITFPYKIFDNSQLLFFSRFPNFLGSSNKYGLRTNWWIQELVLDCLGQEMVDLMNDGIEKCMV